MTNRPHVDGVRAHNASHPHTLSFLRPVYSFNLDWAPDRDTAVAPTEPWQQQQKPAATPATKRLASKGDGTTTKQGCIEE